MKNTLKLFLLIFSVTLITGCSNTEKMAVTEPDGITIVEPTAEEQNTTEFKRDQQRWMLMKDFNYGAEEYIKKHGAYAAELSEYEPYFEVPSNFENELKNSFSYVITSDSEGDENRCYDVRVQFESKHYKQYHNDEGYFEVGNVGQGLCQS